MLDGAARLKDTFAACQQAGMSAVAITDHGNVYGAYDFWAKAGAAGIKPIIGIEAYVAPEHRRFRQPVRWGTPGQKDDDVSGAGAYTHMTLLAESTEGMHNLFRLSSLASLEGYFRKPRMDRGLDVERRYADGLRQIAAELKLPYLVTNDSHYTKEPDAAAHEVLLCVQTGTNMADPARFRFEGTSYY